MNSHHISPGTNKATTLEIDSDTDQDEFNYAFATQTSSDIDYEGTFDEEDGTVLDTSSYTEAELDTNDDKVQVTAIVARLIHLARSTALTRGKQLSQSHKSNLIRVLLDSGSDGELWFQEKGTPKCFPYLARQVPKSWYTSNEAFQTKGRGEVALTFFEYSNSKQYLVIPDIVEYDPKRMATPVFDLILG